MTLRSWIRKLLAPVRRPIRKAPSRCRPSLEALEDRTVPTGILTTLGTPYTQSFDTLPASGSATWTNNSTIPGWFHARTGTGTTLVANNGSSNAGNLYSYGTGTATDRALGSVGTGNAAIGNLFWGVRLQNNTGATITSLDVSYTGEQWRNSAAAAQTLTFSYLVGSPTVTGSLAEFQSAGVAVPGLDFTSPITGGAAGALDGNLADNRVTMTFSITGLNIPNGTEVMLRWSDPDHTGADHGLAIDDFSVTPHSTPTTPIHDIQGPGASSPIVGSSVTTRGIVTGVKSNGFFLQTPDAEVDADPATSEGIFVFTSISPPAAVAVGNEVRVTGTVTEFVPGGDPLQPPLTQLTSPTVTLLSTGHPLPAAVPLGATFPDPAGPVDQLERLEGMRVSVGSLTVTAPTQGSVNEVNATATSNGVFFGVVTGVARPFREPGIQAPDPAPPGGSIPPIPRWDHNPELLRVDSDGLVGTSPLDVGTGAVVTGLVGPLDYASRHYTILPDANSQLTAAGGPTPTSVTPSAADEFTVATYNLDRFFDAANDPAIGEPVLTAAAFEVRLSKASLAIRNNLRMPDILAVQEVENLATLEALAARINSDAVAAGAPDPQYVAYLLEGNDVTGLDVGFLVKTALVSGSTPRVTVDGMGAVQELAGTLFVNPDSSTELLHERPPLRLMATISHPNGASFPVTVINVHPSLLDSNSSDPGSNGWATEGDRVRARRQQQAEDIANLVQARQVADPDERILVVGDFNSFEFNDGQVDFLGTLTGTPSPDNETAVPGDGADLVDPDLVNLVDTAPPPERYTQVQGGSAASLDHILANAPLVAATLAQRVEHARINADFPETARNGTTAERLSAHDPIVVYFQIVVNAAPTDLTLSNSSVAENQPPDTLVGTLSTTDPDSGGTFTYTLVSGEGDADNASFTIDDGSLLTAAGFNFEARSSYSIRVRSTDAGLSTEKVFTLSVTDVNEAPALGGARSGQAVRDDRKIKPFATFSVADPDTPAQALTLTVRQSRPAHGKFTRASLQASGFHKTGRGVYAFSGTAEQAQAALRRLAFNPTDNSVAPGRSVTTAFTVEVSDGSLTSTDSTTSVVARSVNDRPSGRAAAYRLAMNQALAVPAGSGLLAGASDPDGGPLRAELVGGPSAGRLVLHGDGSFLYQPPRDFHGVVAFLYRVRDSHGGSSAPLPVTLLVQPSAGQAVTAPA